MPLMHSRHRLPLCKRLQVFESSCSVCWRPLHASSAVTWPGSSSACLDDKGLARDLAQVLAAQQLARGQHHAATGRVLPAKAAVQVQRLACVTSCAHSELATKAGLLCRTDPWTGHGLSRGGLMQVMVHTCHTGRREAFVLAVLIEPPADQQTMGNVIVGAIRNMCCNQARMYGPQSSSSLHDKDG